MRPIARTSKRQMKSLPWLHARVRHDWRLRLWHRWLPLHGNQWQGPSDSKFSSTLNWTGQPGKKSATGSTLGLRLSRTYSTIVASSWRPTIWTWPTLMSHWPGRCSDGNFICKIKTSTCAMFLERHWKHSFWPIYDLTHISVCFQGLMRLLIL